MTAIKGCGGCGLYAPAGTREMTGYASWFVSRLSDVFGVSGKFVSANIYPTVAKHYGAFELVVHDSKPEPEIETRDGSDFPRSELELFLAHDDTDMSPLNGRVYFGYDSFCIVKPRCRWYWDSVAASHDMAKVCDQILRREEDE
jgi:hypothetical protein